MSWSTWVTCSFAILITSQGVPAEVTWLAREYACVCCIIKVQKECWRGIGEAVGSWERPLCLLVHQGTETSHCESGQRWVTVLLIVFPPPFHSSAQPRTREGEESGFSLMGQLDHAQELSKEGSQSAGYNCHSWSSAIPQQPATCMNATEWLITSTTNMKGQSECTHYCQVQYRTFCKNSWMFLQPQSLLTRPISTHPFVLIKVVEGWSWCQLTLDEDRQFITRLTNRSCSRSQFTALFFLADIEKLFASSCLVTLFFLCSHVSESNIHFSFTSLVFLVPPNSWGKYLAIEFFRFVWFWRLYLYYFVECRSKDLGVGTYAFRWQKKRDLL